MTKTAPSECSCVSELDYDLISSTFAQLRAVISQEASLRKKLDELFGKRTEAAHITVQNAQSHLELVKTQEAQMRQILKQSAAINEIRNCAWNSTEDAAPWTPKKRVAEWERPRQAAAITVIEECQIAEAAKIQEESERLAKLEDERLADLGKERSEEEEGRLVAQEAAMIASVEAREAEPAMLDTMEAGGRELDQAEAELATRKEAERLWHQREIAAQLEHIESEREAEEDEARLKEEERREHGRLEAEMRCVIQENERWIEDEGREDEKRLRQIEPYLLAREEEAERLEQVRLEAERYRLALEAFHRLEDKLETLAGETAVVEERMAMVEMQLSEREAKRNKIIRQLEGARLEEASRRYHQIMRSRGMLHQVGGKNLNALSECSSVSELDCDPISSTFAQLRAVISQEASLRKKLDELFGKRTEAAHIAVQNAQSNLELVKTQEAQMREILKKESAAAKEMRDCAWNSTEDAAPWTPKKQAAEWERLQQAAEIAAIEERPIVDVERLCSEREEYERLAKLEDERLAGLEMERLEKEQEDRISAQEAAIIAAAEVREAEALAEEERIALAEEKVCREAAMIAAVEARRIAEARERQQMADIAALEEAEAAMIAAAEARRAEIAGRGEAEAAMIAAVEARRAEIAAQEEAEILKHEEELREKERLEAELHSFSQWALQRSKNRLEAQQFAEMEQRRADEERERMAQVKAGMYKGQKGGKNKSRRMIEEKARVEGERQEAQRLEANLMMMRNG